MNRGYALQYDEQIISYGIKYVLQVIKTLVIAIAIGSVTQKIMNTGIYVYFLLNWERSVVDIMHLHKKYAVLCLGFFYSLLY